MSGIHIMAPHEGAAVRYQLDGMIKALQAFDRPAAEAGDTTVTELLAGLWQARNAAQQVEDRLDVRAKRKGVQLAKR
jgi:hypothetical protein